MIALSLNAQTDFKAPMTLKAMSAADLLELRLDTGTFSGEDIQKIRKPVIFTLRTTLQGGRFKFRLPAFVKKIERVRPRPKDFIDIEWSTHTPRILDELNRLNIRSRIILSRHFLTSIEPSQLRAFDHSDLKGMDRVKLVFTCGKITDNLAVLENISKLQKKLHLPVISFCMGEAGLLSRLLCVAYGSAWTYAAVSTGETLAPGQVDIFTMKQGYRVNHISKKTKIFGVMGNPARHSLSPVLFNFLFRKYSIDAVYLPLQLQSEKELASLLTVNQKTRFIQNQLRGFSVTMPFKECAFRLAKTHAFPQIPAANTLIRQGRCWISNNTDAVGIAKQLQKISHLEEKKVALIGAGGAAQTIAFVLSKRQIHFTIYNRTLSRAHLLAKKTKATAHPLSALGSAKFDVLINSTGMQFQNFNHVLKPHQLKQCQIVEINYRPIETELIKLAKKHSLVPPLDGLDFFIAQGLRQFEIWTGRQVRATRSLRKLLELAKEDPIFPNQFF
jgi:3-dehydroquinate dehydratase/shikimate dehydrogenase